MEGKTNKTMSFKALIGIYSFNSGLTLKACHRFYFVNPLGLSLIIRLFLSLHLWSYILNDFDGDNPFSLRQFSFAVFVLFVNNNISIKKFFELDNLMLHECNFTT